MIYVGLYNFKGDKNLGKQLQSALFSLTSNSPLMFRKESLTIWYSKLSHEKDLDEIWENDSSCLIGRIFHKETNLPYSKKDFKISSLHNGDELLKKIWGKFVYFNLNKETSELNISIDLTGQLPFFYYQYPNGDVLFSSNIELIYKVLDQRHEFDWAYLCSYLMYGSSSSRATPFKNIYELPPACSLSLTKSEIKTLPYWNPINNIQSQHDTASVLTSTLKAWIAPYQNICVSLSGGLDSSAALYCLKDLVRKDQRLTAVNYYHSHLQASNEFHHAQKVCEETGVELLGIDASASLPFDPPKRNMNLKTNKPYPGHVSLRWKETIFDQISFDGSFSFISGHGSDHIFMRPPSKKCIADYFLKHGFKGLQKKINGISQFYRDPFFSLLEENIRAVVSYAFNNKPSKRDSDKFLKDKPRWIKQEAIGSCSNEFYHPLYSYLSDKIIPGKYQQIDALFDGLSTVQVEMMLQADPTYYPFFSEPVVEHALAQPTYKLFDNGYDRYPLRKAISDRFKTNTVWRRDKSQTTGIFQLGIKKNLDFVLDLCLEGHFVKQGFIEKEGLYKTINLLANGDIKHLWPFMHLASIELFLRHWDEGL